MSWKRAFNDALRSATGLEVRRAKKAEKQPTQGGKAKEGPPRLGKRAVRPLPVGRLIDSPTFILCSLRSGSTLLRVILNSHSQIHAPYEFHLRHIAVEFTSKWADRAMFARGLDTTALEYLLWDRILHSELEHSGKEHVVVKTPNDVFNVGRILECWPDARFIFLLRHPAAIARSRASLRPTVDEQKNNDRIRRYCEALERARQAHPGHTVRYEELTTDPDTVTQGICEFLGVPWEPEMLDYGRFDHGRFRAGLGDWKAKIKTGRIQPASPPPPPDEVPPALRGIAAAWGYISEDAQPPTPAVEAARRS